MQTGWQFRAVSRRACAVAAQFLVLLPGRSLGGCRATRSSAVIGWYMPHGRHAHAVQQRNGPVTVLPPAGQHVCSWPLRRMPAIARHAAASPSRRASEGHHFAILQTPSNATPGLFTSLNLARCIAGCVPQPIRSLPVILLASLPPAFDPSGTTVRPRLARVSPPQHPVPSSPAVPFHTVSFRAARVFSTLRWLLHRDTVESGW